MIANTTAMTARTATTRATKTEVRSRGPGAGLAALGTTKATQGYGMGIFLICPACRFAFCGYLNDLGSQ